MRGLSRRQVMVGAAAAGLAVGAPWRAMAAEAPWRKFTLVTRIAVANTAGASGPIRAWIPVPSFATDWQTSAEPTWTGNPTSARIETDARSGARIFVAEWPAATAAPTVELTVQVSTRDRAVDLAAPGSAPGLDKRVTDPYLAASKLIVTDGIVRTTADTAVGGAKTDVDKARAIYGWIVDHTFRDPAVKGCGTGDIRTMLTTGNLGGKCADLNGLFVGMARSVGVPARELYGVRVADGAAFKCLGRAGDVTKAQHCRAEFAAAGYGWVAVDPADVRKVVLEEDGGLKLTDPKVAQARTKLFGGFEMNWVAFNSAADLALPGSAGAPVPYFMYPQVEVGGVRRDPLDPASVAYTLTSAPA